MWKLLIFIGGKTFNILLLQNEREQYSKTALKSDLALYFDTFLIEKQRGKKYKTLFAFHQSLRWIGFGFRLRWVLVTEMGVFPLIV